MDPTLIPSDGSAAERPEETGGGLALDPEAAPSILKLDDLRKDNPKFRKRWEQDRKDITDQSASAYDVSMATIALGAGWPDQEVVNLLICWRRKHGHDLKLREGYYEITLAKAKEPIVMAQRPGATERNPAPAPGRRDRGADGQPVHALRRGHHPDREVSGRPPNLLHVHRAG